MPCAFTSLQINTEQEWTAHFRVRGRGQLGGQEAWAWTCGSQTSTWLGPMGFRVHRNDTVTSISGFYRCSPIFKTHSDLLLLGACLKVVCGPVRPPLVSPWAETFFLFCLQHPPSDSASFPRSSTGNDRNSHQSNT